MTRRTAAYARILSLSVVLGLPGTALTWSSDYAPSQPGHGSLYFDGGQNPLLSHPVSSGRPVRKSPSGTATRAHHPLRVMRLGPPGRETDGVTTVEAQGAER